VVGGQGAGDYFYIGGLNGEREGKLVKELDFGEKKREGTKFRPEKRE